jgi:hypothetical protein
MEVLVLHKDSMFVDIHAEHLKDDCHSLHGILVQPAQP